MKKALVMVAALASPIIWFASQGAGFALAPVTCTAQSNAWLWFVSVIALLSVCGSGFAAWMQWSRPREAGPATSDAMPRWLAMAGLVLAGGFFIVIVAQTIPTLMLHGCE
ncbi:MAG TPA: hypothetical protein VGL82_16705 [Bryobacteraceae bacterium]|jgi:hypothetical protein